MFFLFYRRAGPSSSYTQVCLPRVVHTRIHTNQPHSVQRRPSPECYVATSPSPLDRPVLVRTLGGNAVKYSVSHSLTRYPSYPRGPLGILHYIYIWDNNNVFIETESVCARINVNMEFCFFFFFNPYCCTPDTGIIFKTPRCVNILSYIPTIYYTYIFFIIR